MFVAGFSGKIGSLVPLIGEDNLPVYNQCLWYRIPLFDYNAKLTQPSLIYTDAINTQYQLDRHFQTDGGSIPFLVRLIPGVHLDPFNFPRAYLYHDCAYQYGGLYIKYSTDDVFKFRLMTRQQVDTLLGVLLLLDGATKADIKTIMAGIWMGSRFVWDNKNKPLEQKAARKASNVVVYDYNGMVIEQNGEKINNIKQGLYDTFRA